MLNDHERRQFAEIESALDRDPDFVQGFAAEPVRSKPALRLAFAAVLAVAGAIGAGVGVMYGVVPAIVLSVCALGAAGAIATWPAAVRRRG